MGQRYILHTNSVDNSVSGLCAYLSNVYTAAPEQVWMIIVQYGISGRYLGGGCA